MAEAGSGGITEVDLPSSATSTPSAAPPATDSPSLRTARPPLRVRDLRSSCDNMSESSELSPTPGGARSVQMSAHEMREWHFIQQYYEDRIRTISGFPVALVALGLILVYYADIICSLAISMLLWLIFSPLIEMLSEPFFFPTQWMLHLAGWPVLRRGQVRVDPNRSQCPTLLVAADMVARIKVPRLLCVMLVLCFIGLCFWLLIAKTFASVSGLLRNSDNLLTLLSNKADDVRSMLDDSVLADTVDWDAVIEQMVSHAREVTTEESIEEGIWWVIKIVRVSLANFFLVFLMFMCARLSPSLRACARCRNVRVRSPRTLSLPA
jgi:hypothetical protein